MVELKLKSELDEYFPRIKADTLPPPQKIVELRRKLQDTPQWKLFKHKSDEARTIRLNLSNLTEKVIPLIHGILEDNDFNYDTQAFKGTSSQKPIIKGIALHEALSLWDLWRFGKTGTEEIDRTFPTNKDDQELILPFINALKKDGRSAEEIWSEFHTDKRLVDRSKYLLSQEFELLPLSIPKQEELRIRASDEVHDAGLLMAKNLSTEVDPELKHYSETLAIFNFRELSSYGNSRIQIPVRFDRVIAEKLDKRNFKYNFFDLKTGKQRPQEVQSLLMEFLAGHFVDEFFLKGELKHRHEPFMTSRIKNIIPHPNFYSFEYGYLQGEEMSTIPVILDYSSGSGEVFLEYLALLSDAACAFKGPIMNYLKYGKPFDRSSLLHYQDEYEMKDKYTNSRVIYTAQSTEPQKRKDKQGLSSSVETKSFVLGETISEINCEKCGTPLTQTCSLRMKGERKSRIRVILTCATHGLIETQNTNVANESIISQP